MYRKTKQLIVLLSFILVLQFCTGFLLPVGKAQYPGVNMVENKLKATEAKAKNLKSLQLISPLSTALEGMNLPQGLISNTQNIHEAASPLPQPNAPLLKDSTLQEQETTKENTDEVISPDKLIPSLAAETEQPTQGETAPAEPPAEGPKEGWPGNEEVDPTEEPALTPSLSPAPLEENDSTADSLDEDVQESPEQALLVQMGDSVDVFFEDPQLLAYIKTYLGIPQLTPLTLTNLLALTNFTVNGAVSSLKGLELAENLTSLQLFFYDLSSTATVDLSPLAQLPSLKFLFLDAGLSNKIYFPQGFYALEELTVYPWEKVTCASGTFTALKNLTTAQVRGNQTDFIATLSSLEYLRIGSGSILNIDFLASLPHLKKANINMQLGFKEFDRADLPNLVDENGNLRFFSNLIGVPEDMYVSTSDTSVTFNKATGEVTIPPTSQAQQTIHIDWSQYSNTIEFSGSFEIRFYGTGSSPAPVPEGTPRPLPTPEENNSIEAAFEDENLRLAIRDALYLPTNTPITAENIKTLRFFHPPALGRPISSLEGLQYAINLESLQIFDCDGLTSLAPLEGFENLHSLILYGNTHFNDLSPIGTLSSLRFLELPDASIQDISALAGATLLYSLKLTGNAIEDIVPLAALKELQCLHLDNNKIKDISPLQNLEQLVELSLTYNRITDISPLPQQFINELEEDQPQIKLALQRQRETISLGAIELRGEYTFINPVQTGPVQMPQTAFSMEWVRYDKALNSIAIDTSQLPGPGEYAFIQGWGIGDLVSIRSGFSAPGTLEPTSLFDHIFSGYLTYTFTAVLPAPTPVPTKSPTPAPTATPMRPEDPIFPSPPEETATIPPTLLPTNSPSPVPTLAPTATLSPTPSPSLTPSLAPTPTSSPAPTLTPMPVATLTPSATPQVPPGTGDEFSIIPYILILSATVLMIIIAIVLLRKKKDKK